MSSRHQHVLFDPLCPENHPNGLIVQRVNNVLTDPNTNRVHDIYYLWTTGSMGDILDGLYGGEYDGNSVTIRTPSSTEVWRRAMGQLSRAEQNVNLDDQTIDDARAMAQQEFLRDRDRWTKKTTIEFPTEVEGTVFNAQQPQGTLMTRPFPFTYKVTHTKGSIGETEEKTNIIFWKVVIMGTERILAHDEAHEDQDQAVASFLGLLSLEGSSGS